MPQTRQKTKRAAQLRHALVTVGIMAAFMFVSIVVLGTSPHIPLVFGCLAAGLMAWHLGFTWEELLEGMIEGITESLEAILILLLIGMLVGTWIAGGTVPTLICYGLGLIRPTVFLPAAMLLCLLVAFAVGSWGTVGTMGLAFMGIGTALQIPAPLVAGAVISGAYMGEVISPLSDATNLASAVTGEKVFLVVRKNLPSAAAAGFLTILLYAAAGFRFGSGTADAVTQTVGPLVSSLHGQFRISPVTLLPMAVMAACILLKMPAIPSMLTGSIAGMAEVILVQKAGPAAAFGCAYEGYVSATGNELIDELLTAGGLQNMMESVSIIFLAMAFGGIMRKTGQTEALVRPLIRRMHGRGAVTSMTVLTCIFMNLILSDQYLGISLPGQMYAQTYDERGISRTTLGADLLGGGAVTSPLIPWNTCGVYCASILGISPVLYGRYAWYSILLPLVVVAGGFLSGRGRVGNTK